MTTPTRPTGVPASARYVAENGEGYRWVDGAVDANGKSHGASKIYADAGYLRNTLSYEHGVQHGLSTVFHPDGSVASTGDWKHGVIFDAVMFRAKAESPETFPSDAAENVKSVRYVSRDGKANQQVLYFDDAGREVTDTGAPMPPHPAGVDADARFFPRRNAWLLGSVLRGAKPKRVGADKEWTADGVLVRDDLYDGAGEAIRKHAFFPDGTTKSLDEFAGDVQLKRERFRSPGVLSKRELRDAEDRPLHETEYGKDGALREERTWTYDATGLVTHLERGKTSVLFEAAREGDALHVKVHDDGRVLAEGLVRNERLAGPWKVFDDAGQVRTEVDVTAFEVGTEIERFRVYQSLQQALLRHFESKNPPFPRAEAIDWATLATCYGTAKGFASALRALSAPEPIVRDAALGQIMSQVEHQGSVYPATAAVAPLLIEALERPSVDRVAVLNALVNISQAAIAVLGDAETSLTESATRLTERDGDWRYAITETLDAIGAGWPILERVLTTGAPKEQGLVITLAGLARGKDLKAEVLSLAKSTTSSVLKATAVDALAGLDGVDSETLAAWLRDDDQLVRVSAAISLGLRFGPRAPAETSAVLSEGVKQFESWRVRYQALPFVSGNALAPLAVAIGSVRTPECFALATPLLAAMSTTDGVTATSVGRGLLALALHRCEPPFMPGFVEVLAGLAACEPFFAFNVNAAEVLRDFGIDCAAVSARETLTSLVTTLRASTDPTVAFVESLNQE